MVDRRTEITKSAGTTPSTTQTTSQKAAAAKATQEANKGLSQKDLALKYGGRYSESGSTFQVGAPTGKAYSITLPETLKFNEGAEVTKRTKTTSGGLTTERTTSYGEPKGYKQPARQSDGGVKNTPSEFRPAQQPVQVISPLNQQGGQNKSVTLNEGLQFSSNDQQGSTAPFAFDIYGEVSSEPVAKEKQFVIFPSLLAQQTPVKSNERLNNLLGKNINVTRTVQESIPILSGVKNAALQLASIGVALGVTVSKPGNLIGGVAKGTREATSFYEKYKSPEYPAGSREDIQQKIGEITGIVAITGGAAKGISGGGGPVTAISRGIQVSRVEKALREPGIISGREKLAPNLYLISKGTETKPAVVPLTTVKFGRFGRGTVGEITPESKTLTPNEINIHGNLSPNFQAFLEAKQTGQFTYKSSAPTSLARSTYAKGVLQGGIKPIAEIRTTNINNILKGKTGNLQASLIKPKGVFAQTRAEKFTAAINKNVPSTQVSKQPSTPFTFSRENRIGAGQGARGFTKQETRTIKETLTPPPKSTQQPEILFAAPRFQNKQTVTEQQHTTFAEEVTTHKGKTKTINEYGRQLTQTNRESLKFNESVKTTITPRQTQKNNLLTKPKEGLKIRDDFGYKLEQRPVVSITEGLKIRDLFSYKLGHGYKLDIPEKLTFKTPEPPRPPKQPKEEIFRPPEGGFFYGPPRGSGSSAGRSEPRSRFNWAGNVPQDQVEGIFGHQQEITYGKVNTSKAKKIVKLSNKKAKGPITFTGFSNTKNIQTSGNSSPHFTKAKGIAVFKKSKSVWGKSPKFRF